MWQVTESGLQLRRQEEKFLLQKTRCECENFERIRHNAHVRMNKKGNGARRRKKKKFFVMFLGHQFYLIMSRRLKTKLGYLYNSTEYARNFMFCKLLPTCTRRRRKLTRRMSWFTLCIELKTTILDMPPRRFNFIIFLGLHYLITTSPTSSTHSPTSPFGRPRFLAEDSSRACSEALLHRK